MLDDDYTALAGPSDEEDASDDEEDDEADDAFLGDEAALQGLEDEEDEDEEDLEDGPPPSRLKRKGILSPDVRNKTKKPKQSVLCGFEQAGRAGKSESETIA